MGGGGRSCEIDGWMDLILGEGWAVVRWGLIGGGCVGVTFFFVFFVGLRWILWAVDGVAKVVGC